MQQGVSLSSHQTPVFLLLLVAECTLSSPLSGFKDDVWPRFGFNTSGELDT